MKDIENWLVVRLSALGDVVLTTGVLSHWARCRGWNFHVLTKRCWAPVFAESPVVSKVVSLDVGQLTSVGLPASFMQLAKEYAGWGLLDLHGSLRSRLLGGLWRGPVLRYPKMSLARRLFLLSGGRVGGDRLLRYSVVQRYALAVERNVPQPESLAPVIYLTDEERVGGEALLPFDKQYPFVVLHPYATHVNKAWAAESWRNLVRRLVRAGYHCVVIGTGDTPFAKESISGEYLVDLTGKTALRQSCALLAAATVLVTGDSGPMHLASAVGTPVVGLFGPTHQAWGFFPTGQHDVVLQADFPCRPCSLHGSNVCDKNRVCMQSITVDAVYDAVQQHMMSVARRPCFTGELAGNFG